MSENVIYGNNGKWDAILHANKYICECINGFVTEIYMYVYTNIDVIIHKRFADYSIF